eukprot:2960034-Amphidinium_carterae.1
MPKKRGEANGQKKWVEWQVMKILADMCTQHVVSSDVGQEFLLTEIEGGECIASLQLPRFDPRQACYTRGFASASCTAAIVCPTQCDCALKWPQLGHELTTRAVPAPFELLIVDKHA